MLSGHKTKGLATACLVLCALMASCESDRGDPGPTPATSSSSAPALTCESLDTLAVGVVIRIGPPPTNSYQPPLMDIAAHQFTWSNGSTTTNGEAKTENTGKAGGSSVEIAVNNLMLSVSRGFGQVLQKVRVSFGEYGGNINVSVNNTFANVDNFAALNNKALGGVNINVLSGGLGNDKGVIEFQGMMPDQNSGLGQFAVGGQELWIDDICFEQ
jgi:hypothetical protein